MARTSTTRLPPHVGANPWVTLVACLLAVFMQMLDVTIVNIALPAIGADLSTSTGALQLIPIAYTLPFACTLLPAAQLGDRVGRRTTFLLGMALFMLASLVAGLSPDASTLVGARFAQGVGGGAMAAQTLAIIVAAFPVRRQPAAFALYAATAGTASILGPILGGALLGLDVGGVGWRAIFLINVPLGILAMMFGRTVANLRPHRAARLDLIGAATCATALSLLILGLTASIEYGWSGASVGALAGAALVTLAFLRHERRWSDSGQRPLLHLRMFRQRSFGLGCALALLVYGAFTGLVFTTSLTLQLGVGLSSSRTALTTTPFAVAAIGFAALSPTLYRRFGSRLLTVGTGAISASLLTMAWMMPTIGSAASLIALWPPLLVAGAGMGLFIAPLQTTVVRDVSRGQIGSASGTLPSVQQVGCTLGLALAGSLFAHELGQGPAARPDYLAAQQTVLLVLAAAAILAVVLALCIPTRPELRSDPESSAIDLAALG